MLDVGKVFMKKNLKKTNQREFRIKKWIKKVINCILDGNVVNFLFSSWNNENDIRKDINIKMS